MHLNFKTKFIMIKKFLILFFAVVFFTACSNENENTDENVVDSTASEMTMVTIANFDTVAANYVGKQVKITGIVDHVCKHGGKKLLLVEDGTDQGVHVDSEKPFDETLVGSKVTVIGTVKEFKVDEAYCQKLETEDSEQNIEGENHEDEISQREEQAQFFRDSMENAGIDHISFYSLEFVSFEK